MEPIVKAFYSFGHRIDLVIQMRQFYCSLFGLLLWQLLAWHLAWYAQHHSKFKSKNDCLDFGTELFVRGFFALVSFVMMFIFESTMHLFQYRHLVCLIFNAVLITARTEMNPIVTYFLLMQITSQWYTRLTAPLQAEIDRAL